VGADGGVAAGAPKLPAEGLCGFYRGLGLGIRVFVVL